MKRTKRALGFLLALLTVLWCFTLAAAAEGPDYSGLEAAIAAFDALDWNEYRADSWVAAAEYYGLAVAARTATDQGEIDEAAANLKAMINSLRKKADTGALEAAVALAEAIDENDYDLEVWVQIRNYVNRAKQFYIGQDCDADNHQDDIDALTALLNEALDTRKIDYDRLQSAICYYDDLEVWDIYTSESRNAAAAAYAAALEAMTATDQDEVDAAERALYDAINDLTEKVDVSELDELIGIYMTCDHTAYSEEALDELERLIGESSNYRDLPGCVWQETLDALVADIRAAYCNTTTGFALKEAIAAFEALDPNHYSAASWAEARSRYDHAVCLLEEMKTDEFSGPLTHLTNALNALVEIADYSALNALLETAEGLEKDDYISDSWWCLQDVLDEVNELPAELPPSGQAQIDAAAEKLAAAIDGLIEGADLSELYEVIYQAIRVKQEDYTDEAWEELQDLVLEAQMIHEVPKEEQAAIDAFTAELRAALNNSILIHEMKDAIARFEALDERRYASGAWENALGIYNGAVDALADGDAHYIEIWLGDLNAAINNLTAVAHTHTEDQPGGTWVFSLAIRNEAALIRLFGEGGRGYLENDVTLTQDVTVDADAALCLGGYVLDLNGHQITVAGEKTFELTDHGTAEHAFSVGENGLWTPDDEGTETVTGGVITGGRGDVGGALHNGGTFRMYAGSFVGNEAVQGGAIYSDSVFVMTGGTVTGNYAPSEGGIFCTGHASFGGTAVAAGNTDIFGENSDVSTYDCELSVCQGSDAPAEGMHVGFIGEVTIRDAEDLESTDGFFSDNESYEVVLEGDVIRICAPSFRFISKSLALDSTLAFRFRGKLLGDEHDENAYMEFIIGDNIRTGTVKLSDAIADGDTVIFTCRLNVLEVNEKITLIFHDGDKTTTRANPITVDEYLEEVKALRSAGTGNAEEDARILALIEAIYNYTYYAQAALDAAHDDYTVGEGGRYQTAKKSDTVPVSPLDAETLASFRPVTTVEESYTLIGEPTCTLYLDAETAISLYFTAAEGHVPTVTVNGTAVEPVLKSDGRYQVVISGIMAHQLAKTFTVNIDGGKVVISDLSALSYAYLVFEGGREPGVQSAFETAVSAMYDYYRATKAARDAA